MHLFQTLNNVKAIWNPQPKPKKFYQVTSTFAAFLMKQSKQNICPVSHGEFYRIKEWSSLMHKA